MERGHARRLQKMDPRVRSDVTVEQSTGEGIEAEQGEFQKPSWDFMIAILEGSTVRECRMSQGSQSSSSV